MERDHPTARVRRMWDRYAPRYDRDMRIVDRLLVGDGRQWVGSRAHGDVLEVAVGTGRNFGHYSVHASLTAVDLSPVMLEYARRNATDSGRAVTWAVAPAESLPFADASFDTVVCTLALCGVSDDVASIGEMRRVLRPGGRLILLDHVASTWLPIRVAQWLIERVSIRLANEHLTRRPLPLVRAAGLRIDETRRTKAGVVEMLVATKVEP